MIKYEDYEEYFSQFNIDKEEANALISYLEALAEIGIKVFNENNF